MRRLLVPLLLVLVAGCSGGDDVAQPQPSPASPTASANASAAGCPETYDTSVPVWVPSPPTTETPGRLVPDADPVEALVCRYEPEGAFQAEVLLKDGRNDIRHDLLLPEKLLPGRQKDCTLVGGPLVPHLMRLTYADGDLWVSAVQDPNFCTDSGNGDFATDAHLGDQLAASFDADAWQPAPDPEACRARRGRLGQERTLVPEGWQSLTVCGPAGERAVERATADQVAELLRELPVEPWVRGCSGVERTTYELLFEWQEGPPVQVTYKPGCEPGIRNGSLHGTATQAQLERLEDLLRAP